MTLWLWKLGIFLATWFELATEFGLGPRFGFFAALLVTFSSTFATVLINTSMRLIGPGVLAMAGHSLVWFILFWWMAPAPLWDLSLLYDVAALVLLALAGAKSRHVVASQRFRAAMLQPRHRFPTILFPVMAGVAAIMLALHVWGSLWPLVGWALLLLIPFRLGWHWAPPAAPERADARMGDARSFEDAGWSAER